MGLELRRAGFWSMGSGAGVMFWVSTSPVPSSEFFCFSFFFLFFFFPDATKSWLSGCPNLEHFETTQFCRFLVSEFEHLERLRTAFLQIQKVPPQFETNNREPSRHG